MEFEKYLNDLLEKKILKKEERDQFYGDFFTMNFKVFYPKRESVE